MKRRAALLLFLIALIGVGFAQAQVDPPAVLATTTILADVAQNVAGDRLTVEALIPRDADAHAFEPSISDAARLAQADLLLAVGAGYETFLADLIQTAGSQAQVIVVSNGIEILGFADEHDAEAASADAEHEHHAAEVIGLLGSDALDCAVDPRHDEGASQTEAEDEHEHGACDPHVWMNPRSVITWTNNIAAALSAADPASAETYRANADAYIAQLEALDAEIAALVAGVPEASRVLVTNHEFMAYFAAAYGFEIVGTVLPAATTDAEPDPQQLTGLIAEVQEEGVMAIFAEVSANQQLAEVVAQEAGIAVVTSLYSESLSEPDGPAATYIAFMRHNAEAIVNALTGTQ